MLRRRDFGGERRVEEGATELAEGWILLSGYPRTQGNSRLSLVVAGLQMWFSQRLLCTMVLFKKRREKGRGDGWQRQWQGAL